MPIAIFSVHSQNIEGTCVSLCLKGWFKLKLTKLTKKKIFWKHYFKAFIIVFLFFIGLLCILDFNVLPLSQTQTINFELVKSL